MAIQASKKALVLILSTTLLLGEQTQVFAYETEADIRREVGKWHAHPVLALACLETMAESAVRCSTRQYVSID